MTRSAPSPEIIVMDAKQLQGLIDRAEQGLDPEDARRIRQLIESYAYVTGLLEDKTTTIDRLRKLFAGAKSEKTTKVLGESKQSEAGADSQEAPDDEASSEDGAAGKDEKPPPKSKRKGHGRNGADDHPGARRVAVPHEALDAGDPCPECGAGTLYSTPPGVLLRFVGQAPLQATVYELEKLRCNLCGEVFTAQRPSEAGDRKYDVSAHQGRGRQRGRGPVGGHLRLPVANLERPWGGPMASVVRGGDAMGLPHGASRSLLERATTKSSVARWTMC
jgi:hypothetical protein